EVLVQHREKPDPATYIGRGKVEKLKNMVDAFDVDLVIFDDELTPSQMMNLENMIEKKIVDRTQLILDIFAMHAGTSESKLQIELAQLEYLLPRLRGHGRDLSRLGGGIGTRGPGETKLETDRRKIKKRITVLKKKLSEISKGREIRRSKRVKSGIPIVSIVGYTNTGKSTFLRRITGYEEIEVEDKLFSTLVSRTKRVFLRGLGYVLFTDTVGFIRKLPHSLIEAFKSTLEEIKYSNLLLIFMDAGDSFLMDKMETVEEVLKEIGVGEYPRILVFNKVDLCTESRLNQLESKFPTACFISALHGYGVNDLINRVESMLKKPEVAVG
ncbi:MAG: GTPase HflX, partial [Thermotogae bacterium]|nr:GTPase HflX [Thermotogota bacterium]